MTAKERTVKQLRAAKARVKDAEMRKGWAYEHQAAIYRERDLLVGALARVYDSHLMYHTHHKKEPKLVVCIHTPAGQLMWTALDTLKPLVADLEVRPNDWDRSRVVDRQDRLLKLASQPRPKV